MALTAQLGEIALALVITIAVLLACAWLVKRTQGGGLMRASGVRVVTSLSLGAKERLVVVELGDTQLALGVTPGSVSVLTQLDEPLPSPSGATEGFAAVLKGVAERG